jgi:hypothetical protein
VQVRQVEFQFKGSRNYIQGPDIFNVMTDIGYPINSLNNIRFTVHDFVRTPICQLYLADTKEALNGVSDIRARCQFEANAASHWLGLTQGAGDAVSGGRYEYDEDRIITLCSMEEEGIALAQQSPFTFIESVVSMNKHMHQQLFPDVTGKWIFTRIDLETGCDAQEKLALRFRHNMNYRLTKSDILVNGKKVGDIYFSLVKS